MKKFFLFLVFLFLFSGCSNPVPATPEEVSETYKQDFSVSAKAVFKGMESEMDVAKNGMSISVYVKSPSELAGMGIEIFDEHAKISYNGMEQEIKKDSLPEGTPFLLLEELFVELSDPEDFTLSTENGNLIADFGDFSAVLSAEDFSLLSAVFPEHETEFVFADFELKTAE